MKAEVFIGITDREQFNYVTKLKANGITFKSIYDKVCDYFEVDTLEEKPKGQKRAPMREIFYMLVFENFSVPKVKGDNGRSTMFRILGEMTNRHRTSIHHYYKNIFLTGAYLTNTEYKYRDNYYMNHFYNVKRIVNGKGSVDKKKFRTVERAKLETLLSKALENNRGEILWAIERGEDLKYINERYIGYTKVSYLREQIRLSGSGLARLMRYHYRRNEQLLK